MVGTTVGVIGVILAIYFYFKSKPVSRINYQTSNLKIIGNLGLNLPSDFEVTLSGEKIESLYKSQVIIWNGGTTTLYGKDTVQDEPLRAVLDEKTKIFNVAVVGESRKANKFEAMVDDSYKNEVKLSFDYLNRNDGILLEILHTESSISPKIIGELKGLSDGIRKKGEVEYVKASSKSVWSKHTMLRRGFPLIISLICAVSLTFLVKEVPNAIEELSNMEVFFAFASGMLLAITGISNINTRKKYPRSIKLKVMN